jgi:hypothetical protein
VYGERGYDEHHQHQPPLLPQGMPPPQPMYGDRGYDEHRQHQPPLPPHGTTPPQPVYGERGYDEHHHDYKQQQHGTPPPQPMYQQPYGYGQPPPPMYPPPMYQQPYGQQPPPMYPPPYAQAPPPPPPPYRSNGPSFLEGWYVPKHKIWKNSHPDRAIEPLTMTRKKDLNAYRTTRFLV